MGCRLSQRDRHRLARRHRRAQAHIGAETVTVMAALWGLIDIDDLDGSTLTWLSIVGAFIGRNRHRSSVLASRYYQMDRELAVTAGMEPFTPSLAERIEMEQLFTSLQSTGPDTVRQALQRITTTDRAMQIGRDMSARAGMRHVLAGGRDTIQRAIIADPEVIGWARVTDGDACAFCAMLASRGPAYLSEQTASRGADGDRYHDGCSCEPAPVYTSDQPLDEQSQRFRDLWRRTTGGYSGLDALNAYRRALYAQKHGQPIEQPDIVELAAPVTPATIEQILAGR